MRISDWSSDVCSSDLCRSYQFSKVCETFSTAMPCLWHGLRMGETGEPRTGGGKQRTGRSRAMADIMPVVGRAAFRRFGFVQSSVVSRWTENVGRSEERRVGKEGVSTGGSGG